MIANLAIRRFRRPGAFTRTVLVATSIALAAVHPADAQAVTATSGDPSTIARIRSQFAEIEREAPGYRRTRHDVWGFSLEGGELEGSYRGRELRKLKATLYGETWRGTEEYYFSGGRPVFIFVVHERYDRPFTMKFRIRLRIEDRYYFDGGRLIRHVHARHPASEEWDVEMSVDEQVTELLKTAGLFAACAAATGAEPPECTAPERDPQKP